MSNQKSEHEQQRSSSDNKGEAPEYRRRAKEHTIAGAVLGTASAGALVTLGSVACPLCIVAAPVLIGSGLWNRRQAKKCQDNNSRVPSLKKGDRIQWSKG